MPENVTYLNVCLKYVYLRGITSLSFKASALCCASVSSVAMGRGGGVILPLLPVQINVGNSSNLRPKGWQFQQLKAFSFQLSCIGVGDGVSNVKVVSYDGQVSVRQAILNADSSFVLLYFY